MVRADTAGHVQAFVAGLVARNIEFSISARVSDLLDAAIMAGAGAAVAAGDQP